MKILIVEDEMLAAERLEELILSIQPQATIQETLDSVETAVEWFKEEEHPDLAFFDIQLADGLSFEIFEKCTPNCPIIFTTAFDEYALKAFKVNSIDYLLKPIDPDELKVAFQKYEAQYQQVASPASPNLDLLQQTMQMITRQYKTRFMIKSGSRLFSIPVEEIDYFFSENKITWLRSKNGKRYQVDYILEQLEQLLDPRQFFRLNRQFITAYSAIEGVTTYSNSRLKIKIRHHDETEDILISRGRVLAFKSWMDQ